MIPKISTTPKSMMTDPVKAPVVSSPQDSKIQKTALGIFALAAVLQAKSELTFDTLTATLPIVPILIIGGAIGGAIAYVVLKTIKKVENSREMSPLALNNKQNQGPFSSLI